MVTGPVAVFSILVIMASSPAIAATGSAAWLERGGGGRWLGSGGAARAATNDVYAGYWNPAALSMLGPVKWQVGSMLELQDLGRSTLSLAAALQTDRRGAYSLTLIRHSMSGIEEVDALGNVTGEATSAGNALLLSGGWALSYKLRFGLTAKVIQESLYDFSAFGEGADAGFLYQPVLSENLWLAFTVENAFSSIAWEGSTTDSLARAYAGGVAWRAMQEKILLSVDVVMRDGQDGMALHVGGEVWAVKELAFQAGFNDGNPCAGVTYAFGPLEVDYAFTFNKEKIGTRHQVNLLFKAF